MFICTKSAHSDELNQVLWSRCRYYICCLMALCWLVFPSCTHFSYSSTHAHIEMHKHTPILLNCCVFLLSLVLQGTWNLTWMFLLCGKSLTCDTVRQSKPSSVFLATLYMILGGLLTWFWSRPVSQRITVKFCKDIHGAYKMKTTDFSATVALCFDIGAQTGKSLLSFILTNEEKYKISSQSWSCNLSPYPREYNRKRK